MTLTDEDLDYLLAEDQIAPAADFRKLERDFDVWFEEGPWLVLLLLPLAALCFRRGWLWSLPLLLILPHEQAAASLWDDLWATRDQQAQQAMLDGDAATAATLFNDADWRAAAQYRSADYSGAATHYAEQASAASGADAGADAGANSAFNLGNSLARLGQYDDAIKAYEQALAKHPNDEDAAANKALVEELLNKQQQDQKDQGEDGDNSQSEDPSADQNKDSEPGDPSDEEQSDSGEQSDADKDATDDSSEAEKQQQGDQDQASEEQKMSEEDSQPMDDEERQALENWLRKVPDDPGGLLRRKFEMQYSERLRQGRSNQNGNQSNW